MTQFSNPHSGHNGPPDDSPETLRGIAERLQIALEEAFTEKPEAEPCGTSSNRHEPRKVGDASVDRRLYVPFSEGWEVRIKTGPRDYCSFRSPGEDGFHLLVSGEIYLQYGSQKMCLRCAYRQGFITDDRLFWQTGHRRAVLPNAESETTSGDVDTQQSSWEGTPT